MRKYRKRTEKDGTGPPTDADRGNGEGTGDRGSEGMAKAKSAG